MACTLNPPSMENDLLVHSQLRLCKLPDAQILRILILDNTNSQCIGPFTMLGQHPLVLALINFLQMLCSDFLKEIMYSKLKLQASDRHFS